MASRNQLLVQVLPCPFAGVSSALVVVNAHALSSNRVCLKSFVA